MGKAITACMLGMLNMVGILDMVGIRGMAGIWLAGGVVLIRHIFSIFISLVIYSTWPNNRQHRIVFTAGASWNTFFTVKKPCGYAQSHQWYDICTKIRLSHFHTLTLWDTACSSQTLISLGVSNSPIPPFNQCMAITQSGCKIGGDETNP